MKSLHKQTVISVRLSRTERAKLREAAKVHGRTSGRPVTPSELLREGGLAKAAEILQAAAPADQLQPSAA